MLGAYWCAPECTACEAAATSGSGGSKSGYPWDRLTAPSRIASSVIVEKIDVPNPRNADRSTSLIGPPRNGPRATIPPLAGTGQPHDQPTCHPAHLSSRSLDEPALLQLAAAHHQVLAEAAPLA